MEMIMRKQEAWAGNPGLVPGPKGSQKGVAPVQHVAALEHVTETITGIEKTLGQYGNSRKYKVNSHHLSGEDCLEVTQEVWGLCFIERPRKPVRKSAQW